jgi:hypothetical protein
MAQRPGSIGIYTCDDVAVEIATSKCAHCQHLTDIPSRRKMTDHVDICRQCNALICLGCAGKPCTPWQKQIEAQEREFYRQQQFRKSLGF